VSAAVSKNVFANEEEAYTSLISTESAFENVGSPDDGLGGEAVAELDRLEPDESAEPMDWPGSKDGAFGVNGGLENNATWASLSLSRFVSGGGVSLRLVDSVMDTSAT